MTTTVTPRQSGHVIAGEVFVGDDARGVDRAPDETPVAAKASADSGSGRVVTPVVVL